MNAPLWTIPELMAATGGTLDRHTRCNVDICLPDAITGISIDTRSLQPGELFVALKDQRDGHEFVPSAFKAGASAALVVETYERQPGDGVLIRVPDVLHALEAIGRAARARLSPEARVIAVTGSAGKTTTKEMLRACLSAVAPGRVHASDKSFNNHWGVPLTLARMPRDTRYAVFEIGMNHSGEITPLSKMVRPHIAIVTNILPVHLGNFADGLLGIAKAKAEIMDGMSPGGLGIINATDDAPFKELESKAHQMGLNVFTYGKPQQASKDFDSRLISVRNRSDETTGRGEVTAHIGVSVLTYDLAIPGAHIAENSVAVLSCLQHLGVLSEHVLLPLAAVGPSPGRGERLVLKVGNGRVLLIDEAYNANPASMKWAIYVAGQQVDRGYERLVLVLGDMLELGPQSGALHRGLKEAIDAAGVDLVFAAGSHMKLLFDELPPGLREGGLHAETSAGLVDKLLASVRAGDVVMIKGSNGSRMGVLVEALKARYARA